MATVTRFPECSFWGMDDVRLVVRCGPRQCSGFHPELRRHFGDADEEPNANVSEGSLLTNQERQRPIQRGDEAIELHSLFAFDRISHHMTRLAKTIAMLCITTYPAGVARNSFTDLTVHLNDSRYSCSRRRSLHHGGGL